MRTAAEIKNQILETLAESLDEPLKAVGFNRNRRSLVYVRNVNGAEHRITFVIHSYPKYQPGAEAHIYPAIQIGMPQVCEAALALVNGDMLLLANAPDMIVSQPAEFTAPQDKRQQWFTSGNEQFIAACESIKTFLFDWVLPFLSQVSTPADLVRIYETNDDRMMKLQHWHIRVAAAYQVLGKTDKAREVVQRHFGSLGLRRRYAPLFTSLAIE